MSIVYINAFVLLFIFIQALFLRTIHNIMKEIYLKIIFKYVWKKIKEQKNRWHILNITHHTHTYF